LGLEEKFSGNETGDDTGDDADEEKGQRVVDLRESGL